MNRRTLLSTTALRTSLIPLLGALALPLCAVALLAGCAGTSVTQVTAAANTTISKAQSDVQTALNVYGVAKGIADVAAVADPALAGPIASATAVLDPLATQAQTALNDATTDANALEALAVSINAQTSALTAATASKVTVIPNAAVPAS